MLFDVRWPTPGPCTDEKPAGQSSKDHPRHGQSWRRQSQTMDPLQPWTGCLELDRDGVWHCQSRIPQKRSAAKDWYLLRWIPPYYFSLFAWFFLSHSFLAFFSFSSILFLLVHYVFFTSNIIIYSSFFYSILPSAFPYAFIFTLKFTFSLLLISVLYSYRLPSLYPLKIIILSLSHFTFFFYFSYNILTHFPFYLSPLICHWYCYCFREGYFCWFGFCFLCSLVLSATGTIA